MPYNAILTINLGEGFLDRADPWIIAHVIAKGSTVVTHEQKSPEASNKVNIPNV